MSVDGFVFVDLETTGTVAAKCTILEIGFALYSADLELIERLEILPVTTGTTALIEQLRRDPEYEFVANMHTENGLFADLEAAAASADALPTGMAGYEDDVLQTLTRWGVDGTTPLSGTSHRMDRDFLEQWMPKVDAMFSYRMIDSRVFTEAGRILDPARTAERTKLITEYGGPTHRVAEDMHHSANVLRVFHGRAPIPFPA
ncbi:oligoribonuclease [Rhodococcus sp. Br-6]|nr:oligoribonuclease [Rhodococcus sp. Br-6]